MLDFEDILWTNEVLKEIDLFSGCSNDTFSALVENFEKIHYKAGATILFLGEISNRFYVIRKGVIGIWKNVNGERKKVVDLGEKNYFGEISLMTSSCATATVKAQTDAEVLSISFESFEFAFRNNPDQIKIIKKNIEERKKTFL